jgi:hypothetical protein
MSGEAWATAAVGAMSVIFFVVQRRDLNRLSDEANQVQRRLADIEEARRRDETRPEMRLEYVERDGNEVARLHLTNLGPPGIDAVGTSIIRHAGHPDLVAGFMLGHGTDGWLDVGALPAGETHTIDLNERDYGGGGELRLRWKGTVEGESSSDFVSCDVPPRYEPMMLVL